jgi:murein DD-endopeptidase MepM/ murein hydrolase activator NlpD
MLKQQSMRKEIVRKKLILLTLVSLPFIQALGQPFEVGPALACIDEIPSNVLYQEFWDHINIGYYKLSDELIPDTLVLEILPAAWPAFVFPSPNSNKVISRFGKRGSRYHSGTDIKIVSRDTIVSAFDGKVRLSRSYHGYGYMVTIRHFNGLETVYGHLSKILVKDNEWVNAGSPIGLGGRTGRATTDHLHFETRILGVPINSEEYIDFEKKELKANVLYFDKRKRKIRSEMFEREQFYDPIPFLPSISNIKVFTNH